MKIRLGDGCEVNKKYTVVDVDRHGNVRVYSPMHIRRMEAEDRFPKRIHLGPNRVGWSLKEIQDWIEARKAERDTGTAASNAPSNDASRPPGPEAE